MQELQIFIPQTMNNLIFNSILILFAMLYLNLILFAMCSGSVFLDSYLTNVIGSASDASA